MAERLIPNAVDDGEVVGCAFGSWLPTTGDATGAGRWRLDAILDAILDEAGAPWIGKPEGLALHPNDPTRAWIVVDKDDPSAPAELLTLTLD